MTEGIRTLQRVQPLHASNCEVAKKQYEASGLHDPACHEK